MKVLHKSGEAINFIDMEKVFFLGGRNFRWHLTTNSSNTQYIRRSLDFERHFASHFQVCICFSSPSVRVCIFGFWLILKKKKIHQVSNNVKWDREFVTISWMVQRHEDYRCLSNEFIPKSSIMFMASSSFALKLNG